MGRGRPGRRMMVPTGTAPSTLLQQMTFSTLVYEREHGRRPRGRGSWAFCPYAKHNSHDYLDHTVFSPGSMTLTEAKRWAKTKIEELRGAGAPLNAPCMNEIWAVMP
jgi:hypothetical protein